MGYIATPTGNYRKLTNISSGFNGVTTTFQLSVPPGTSAYYVTPGSTYQLIISVGGVIQEPGIDYTLNLSQITFTTAPAAGLSFFGVLMGDAINIGAPSDGTVNTAKLTTDLTVTHTFGSAGSPSITFTGDTNNGIFSPATDNLAVTTAGVERFRIDSSGRVGIGTSSPGATLQVQGAINVGNQAQGDGTTAIVSARGLFIGTNQNTGSSTEVFLQTNAYPIQPAGLSSPSQAFVFSGWSGGGIWHNAIKSGQGQFLSFHTGISAITYTDTNERLRIDSSGNLLVGYTSSNGSYKLQVNSQIFATSATIATSDGRYKENVSSLDGCLNLVKALRPVSFTWKPQENITRVDDKGNKVLVREGHNFPEGIQVGFIAQEVQEVLADKPWLNSVIKENVRPAVKDNEGSELAPEEQFFGIAEGNLIAILTNALQEAIAKIETLEAKVATLT